ncbi:AAA family ATPase [Alcanivorax sp. S71-1-4]|uniref:AAA family ATPase n=1 Tax=Alcanivorax sp. S71-1-4 TaxID=1177159 RepID=UPI0013583151|nr:AAA family ATPase [Alcanivorax sp. S71-1-4]
MKSDVSGIVDEAENDQVSILIGDNGGGKSQMLSDLAIYYISKGRSVISIANCVQDKFFLNSKRHNFIGARYGSEMFKIAILKALMSLGRNDSNSHILARALDYSGYLPDIGISYYSRGVQREGYYVKEFKNKGLDDVDFWIDLSSSSTGYGYGINSIKNLSESFRFQDDLSPIPVSFFFKKKDKRCIPLSLISSGEAARITIYFFIAAYIEDGAVVIIDEPENSLHPRWQRKFVESILDIFYLYSPRILIATHSPLIISKKSMVYKIENFKVVDHFHGSDNTEEKLMEMFEIVSQQSAFLSRYIVNFLEDYRNRKLSYQHVLKKIEELERMVDSDSQKKMLKEIAFAARKLKGDGDSDLY